MTDLLNLSTAKLKRIIALKQQIERLSAQLQSLAGGPAIPGGKPPKKKWTMSASARAKIGAAQKARWAKVNAVATPAEKKRTMSAAGRAAVAAAQKARWAKIHAAAATPAKKKRTISAAGRAKIAAAAKARWAKVRAEKAK
jgi:hypothetical protein